eukprot:5025595-Heterocapsa_arctica.AAC.1
MDKATHSDTRLGEAIEQVLNTRYDTHAYCMENKDIIPKRLYQSNTNGINDSMSGTLGSKTHIESNGNIYSTTTT